MSRAGTAAAAATLPVLGLPAMATSAPRAPAKPRPARSARGALPAPAAVLARGAELADLEMVEAASLLQSGAVSSRELTEAAYARIEARDSDVTAWIRPYPEIAFDMALAADRVLTRVRRGHAGDTTLVTGVPIGVKDIIAIEGLPLTFGSAAFTDNVAPGDSPVWLSLKAAGCVLLGHTRTLELASGGSPQTSSNPWDLTKSPGGSSNGSGAAVGAREVAMALGTDSGGSLRRPATANGVCTIKATYGRVSNWGILTTNRNGDHVGPLARSAADCALTLSYIAGPDPNDPPTLAAPEPPPLYPTRPLAKGPRPFRGMVFGVTQTEPTLAELDPGVRAVFETFLQRIAALGGKLAPFASPERVGLDSGGPSPEAVAFQRQWFAERGALYSAPARESAEETLARQNEGTIIGYYDSLRARAAYIEAWKAVFASNGLDAVLTPATVKETPARDAFSTDFGPNIRGYWNTLGFPVVGIPGGYSPDTGLPVGVQIAGSPFTEAALLQIAIDYQAGFDEHHRDPAEVPLMDPTVAQDPTGVVPSQAAFRLVTVAEPREPVDPTGVVPLGPGFYGIKTPIVMEALTTPAEGGGS